MRNGRIELLLATALAAPAAGPAAAQGPVLRTEYEQLTERRKARPAIPPEFRQLLAAVSPQRLLVHALDGRNIPIDIEWWEPGDYRRFADNRYIGMTRQGYEDYGYVLVDRAGSGEAAVIATGALPLFSPDGRHFAAAEISASGYNNLEGIAVWEALPERTVRRFFTDALPAAHDWRVDGWPRPGCVALSAVDLAWQPPAGQDWERALTQAPRSHYGVEIGGEIALRATGEQPACGQAAQAE